ncbi:MAG: hypothetical protein EZS28_034859, partial [Streblomastix strix]
MSLALVGTQSLDELQEMAGEYFSPIANFDVPTIDEEILGKEYVKQLSESSQQYTQICSDLIRNYYLGKNKRNKDEKLNEQQHDDKDQQRENIWELEWKKKCEKYGELHQSGVLVLHSNSSSKSSSDSDSDSDKIIIKPPSLIPLPNNNTIFPEEVFNSNQIYIALNYRQAAILSLQFLMPSSYPFSFLSSPIHIISHLIGHEGKGSLLSELRKKMLASELTTSVTQQNSDFIVFKMDIQLTQEGSNQIEEIIDLCFQYIDMLKQTVGIPDILDFHTQESSEPLNQALNYSHNLLDYSPEYAICGQLNNDNGNDNDYDIEEDLEEVRCIRNQFADLNYFDYKSDDDNNENNNNTQKESEEQKDIELKDEEKEKKKKQKPIIMHINEYRRLLRRRLTAPITNDHNSIAIFPRQYKQMVPSPLMTDGVIVVEDVPINPLLDKELYENKLQEKIKKQDKEIENQQNKEKIEQNDNEIKVENNSENQIVKIPAPKYAQIVYNSKGILIFHKT